MATYFDIGKDKFSVDLIDPWESFLLEPILLPVVAEIVPAVMAAVNVLNDQAGGGKVADLEFAQVLPVLDAIAPAVGKAFSKLPPDKLDFVARKLLANATMNGQPLFMEGADPIRVLLRGRTLTIWRVLYASLQENYADFFGVLGRGARSPAGDSGTSSDSAPPGPAGGS